MNSSELDVWIARALKDDKPVLEIASFLAQTSLSGDVIGPAINGSEGWYWPWNRAGFFYIDRSRASDASLVFTCAYLTALRIQNDLQERVHKGMPLCNVAYSCLTAGELERATIPAAAGMIDDVITRGDPQSINYRNLLAAGFSPRQAELLAQHGLKFYRGRGRHPLYPEVVLDSHARTAASVSPDFLAEIQSLAASFAPDSVEEASTRLHGIWDDLHRRLLAVFGMDEFDEERTGSKHGTGHGLGSGSGR